MEIDIGTENDGRIKLSVDITIPNGDCYTYYFYHNGTESSNDFAEFLADAIQTQFMEHVGEIRRNAYNAGWEDKTKRQKRVTDFSDCPNYTGRP